LRFVQLDGLRALALLMVFLLHHSLLKSGWAGVDIFFILSGFLITGILRRERDDPAFSRTFYTKRAARLLPPLLLLFPAVLVMQRHFAVGSLGYLLFGGNILQLTRYRIAELSPLWSLAIEEHFYFVWPFVIRYLRRESVLRACIVIVAVSPIARAVGTLICRHWWCPSTGWDNPIFLLTPFRIDGLAAGSALALLVEGDRRPRALAHWSWVGSAAAATLFLTAELADKTFRRTTDSLLFNSIGYSLVVAASFFLLAHLVLNPRSRMARCLSVRPIVFIGTISYGFYLYQEAVMNGVRSIAGHGVSLRTLCVPDFIATALVAALSFYLLEKPMMRRAKLLLSRTAARLPAGRSTRTAIEVAAMELEQS